MDFQDLCYRELEKASDHRFARYSPDEPTDRNPDYFKYIPTYHRTVARIIEHLKDREVDFKLKSFIDIGCGVPAIPRIFKKLGCHTSKGLEYYQGYIAAYPELIHGDLLSYNFGEYDILYSYSPIKHQDIMREGLKNIINTMRKRAIFYYCDGIHALYKDPMGFKRVEELGLFYYVKH